MAGIPALVARTLTEQDEPANLSEAKIQEG